MFTLAPSRLDARVLWAGSDDGLVHVTRDGGKAWQNVTPRDLPEFTRISLIEASPHEAGTAYLAGNRYQRADRAPYVYRTSDYGRTWTKIVAGIPEGDFARVIREDHRRRGLLFLGTESGVYVSFDEGANWQSLRLEMPVTPIHGIEVKDDDLVIGTHGRSFYVLDNIGVLRQASRHTTEEPVALFDPPDVTRSIARGVPLDYFLGRPAESVKIEILDGDARPIVSFSGKPEKEGSGPAGERPAGGDDEEEGSGRGAPPARVTVKQGMNRFTCDMRYPGARTFPNLILWAASVRGPQAPPGRYQVRLTADGVTKTQDFHIRRNAAVKEVTDADLHEQFALARQINDKVNAANEAVLRIRSLKDQIADRTSQRNDEAIKSAGDSLTQKLTGFEGEIYQYRNRSSQDPLNFPIRLNNKLAALQGLVEMGDNRPTAQSYAVFKELSARLDVELGRLDALAKADLAAFNKRLTSRGLAAVNDGVPPPATSQP